MAQFVALAGNRRSKFLYLHWPQVDGEEMRLVLAKQHGKTMWGRLMNLALKGKTAADRFSDLVDYYTTHWEKQFKELPEQSADLKTIAAVCERNR